jgi:L-asparaginase II
MTMLLRSTAKPFQAQALFGTGAVDRFGLTAEEIALACASHDSMPRHIGAVRAWLSRVGLSEDDLVCGPHLPGNAAAQAALIRELGEPTPIHNNCSGKHTAMLTSCLAAGWSTEDYLEPAHPLQRYIAGVLQELSGEEPQPGATDGCSAPTFGLTVRGTATMFARLASPSSSPEALRKGLNAAFAAMRDHPDLIAGPTTVDTLLMRAYPNLACKRGADGGYGLALRSTDHGPLGAAVWVHDGSSLARASAVLAVLDFLGSVATDPAPLATLDAHTRRNRRHVAVGHYEAHLGLAWTE